MVTFYTILKKIALKIMIYIYIFIKDDLTSSNMHIHVIFGQKKDNLLYRAQICMFQNILDI